MSPESARPPPGHPARGRHETAAERADRNWIDLLQELRVSQTGAQLIAGFLLTLPFQSTFADLDRFQVSVYLALVLLSVATIALTLTPVAVHRRLFGKHVKEDLVRAGHRTMYAVICAIGLLITGIVLLVFDVVVGRGVAVAAAAAVLVLTAALLVAVPREVDRRARR
jgi:hypothetical protein